MPREIAERPEQEVGRPLKVLVPLIKQELTRGDNAGLEHYRRAGEMLLEAKAQVERGHWTAWIRRNFGMSEATVKRYMKLAEVMEHENGKVRRRTFTTLSEATEPARANHQPQWHEPVREAVARVDVDKLAQERLKLAQEQKLMRDLALQLIDIGYKALATKLHPDRGGSSEAMTRLNRVRQMLRAAV